MGDVIHIHLGPDPDFVDERPAQRVIMDRDYIITVQVAHQRRKQSEIEKALIADSIEYNVRRSLGTAQKQRR